MIKIRVLRIGAGEGRYLPENRASPPYRNEKRQGTAALHDASAMGQQSCGNSTGHQGGVNVVTHGDPWGVHPGENTPLGFSAGVQ